MWPDSPYAVPRSSFANPVPAPVGEPTTPPTKTITVACEYLPYIRGALKQLLLQSTWQTDIVPLNTTQGRMFNLIDLFQECAGGIPIACPVDFEVATQPGSVFLQPDTPCAGHNLGIFAPFTGFEATSDTSACDGNSYRGAYVYIDLPSGSTLHYCNWGFDLFKGSHSTGHNVGIFAFNGGTFVGQTVVEYHSLPDGFGQAMSLTPSSPVACTRIYFQMLCDFESGSVSMSGACSLNSVDLLIESTAGCP